MTVFYAEVVNLVASIMPILALFQVFDGLAGYTGGNLRAIGKQVCELSRRRLFV